MGGTSLNFMTLNAGKKIKGINDVAGMGMASVIHHKAIRIAKAKVRCPSGENPIGVGKSRIVKKTGIPKKKPVFCLKEYSGWFDFDKVMF